MKHSELLEQFYHARGLYITALKAYVLLNDGVVECGQTETMSVVEMIPGRWYLKRVKYKSLISEGNKLKVIYFVSKEQDGDWEEHEDPIEYFSMDELFHITEDIISEGD